MPAPSQADADRADSTAGGQSHLTRLGISGLALVPFVIAMGAFVGPLYHHSAGQPLLGKAWKDAILCIGVLLLYFVCSLVFMYMRIPLP
jgi:hypothetical protein